MRRMLLIVIFLCILSTIGAEGNCDCDHTFGSDELADSVILTSKDRSCSLYETCKITIFPQENTSILLTLDSFEHDVSYANIYTFLPPRNGSTKTYFLARREKGNSRLNEFSSAINAGMILERTTDSEWRWYSQSPSIVRVNFKRENETEETCDPLLAVVGEDEKVVQQSKEMTIFSGCNYAVIPKNTENNKNFEFLFEIKTSVQVTVYSADPNTNEQKSISMKENKAVRSSIKNVLVVTNTDNYKKGSYQSAEITARLVKDTCLCNNNTNVLPQNNQNLTIYSPGFPEFSCPNLHCINSIKIERTNISGSTGILAISGFYDIGSKDQFLISGRKYVYELNIPKLFLTTISVYSSNKEEGLNFNLDGELYISENDVNVTLKSDDSLNRRDYKVNVRRIFIKNECLCSLYNEKEPTNAKTLEMKIPEYCDFVFCHWRPKISQNGEKLNIAMMIVNGSDEDVIEINNQKDVNRFYGSQLARQRKLSISKNGAVNIFFKRASRNRGQFGNITLNLEWNTVTTTTCKCGEMNNTAVTGVPFVLTSTGYPEYYCSGLACNYNITAPNNTFFVVDVDEINIENFHDYVEFFDENNKTIQSFTGTHKNKQFNTTSHNIRMVFRTDHSEHMRGYHIHFLAVEKSKVEQPSSSSFLPVTLIFLVLAVASFVAVIAYLMRNEYWNGYIRESVNRTVSFSTSTLSSTIN